jgi:hypothetical protein
LPHLGFLDVQYVPGQDWHLLAMRGNPRFAAGRGCGRGRGRRRRVLDVGQTDPNSACMRSVALRAMAPGDVWGHDNRLESPLTARVLYGVLGMLPAA